MSALPDHIGQAASSVNLGSLAKVAGCTAAGLTAAQISDWLGIAAQAAALVYTLLQIRTWWGQRARRQGERQALRRLHELIDRQRRDAP